MKTIDEYLKSIQPDQRKALQRVRGIIKECLPEAEETISWGMPTYKYKGKNIIHFAAFKNHMSIFGNLDDIKDKLSDFTISSKGTLQFTVDKPLPKSIIQEIIKDRLARLGLSNKEGEHFEK
jgi:uncharacterized protein YdhG (YjbR/CyaY superfamily)